MSKLTRSRKQRLLDSQRSKAMIKVKSLVKSFGRTTIQYCLNQLREYEKKVKQLAELKQEAQKLEREIK